MSVSEVDIEIAGGALARDATRAFSVAIPTSLGWDSVNYPLSLQVVLALGGGRVGVASLKPEDFFTGYTGWTTYWVKVDGDDTKDGSSETNAFKSIWKAVAAAITASLTQVRVRVKGGTNALFDRNHTFTINPTMTGATLKVVYEAYNGRVAGTTAQGLTWAADATFTNTYSATRSSVARVFDLLGRDANGHYVELKKVASAAICNITPNSWALVSGTLYARRGDGATVADANTRVLLTVDNFYLRGSTQYSALLIGETDQDGFDLEGGQAAALRVAYTGGAGGSRVVVAAKNCTFRYSGDASTAADSAGGAVGNVAIEGLNGLAIFENCDASCGATDCWNFHNALGASMYVLTNNCRGVDAGKGYKYVSCNGWTGHDSVIGIDLCGDYRGNRGVTVHWIGTSKALCAGTVAAESLGDIVNSGGTNYPCEFKAEDTAQLWLDLAAPRPRAGQRAILVDGSGVIRKRRMLPLPRGSEVVVSTGSGNTITTY